MKHTQALEIQHLMIGTIISIAGLMLSPSSLHGQSEYPTSITSVESVSITASHVGSTIIELQAYRIETSGSQETRFRLVTTSSMTSSQNAERSDTEDESNRKSGFFYRNRYLITGTAVAAGVGTYVILKSRNSKGDPVYLPIPPGRP